MVLRALNNVYKAFTLAAAYHLINFNYFQREGMVLILY